MIAFVPSLNKELDSPTSGEQGRSLPKMRSVRRQRSQRRCQPAMANSTCEKIKSCSSHRPKTFSKCQAARGTKVVLRMGQRERVCGRLRHPHCGHLNLASPALVVALTLKVKPFEDGIRLVALVRPVVGTSADSVGVGVPFQHQARPDPCLRDPAGQKPRGACVVVLLPDRRVDDGVRCTRRSERSCSWPGRSAC